LETSALVGYSGLAVRAGLYWLSGVSFRRWGFGAGAYDAGAPSLLFIWKSGFSTPVLCSNLHCGDYNALNDIFKRDSLFCAAN
jgi:hypothetical protein